MKQPAAVTGYATLSKVLKDGTIRFIVDVQPEGIDDFGGFHTPDMPVFLVRRVDGQTLPKEGDSGSNEREAMEAQEVGEFWRKIHVSGVIPALVRTGALGSDSDYLAWLRTRKCHNCRAEPPCEAAHVRRVHLGSGTGIKPPYSAVTLCSRCHRLQHQHGEMALSGGMEPFIPDDKENFIKAMSTRIESWLADDLLQFGRHAMKKMFGAESAKDIPIDAFKAICEENGVRI